MRKPISQSDGLKRRDVLALKPVSLISRATRFSPTLIPSSFKLLKTRGLP